MRRLAALISSSCLLFRRRGRRRRGNHRRRPLPHHLQKLLGSPRAGIGLVGIRLLVRRTGLGDSGLRLALLLGIVGVFVGLVPRVGVIIGRFRRRCRSNHLLSKGLHRRARWGNRPWLSTVGRRLGLSRSRLGRKRNGGDRRRIRTRSQHHIVELRAVQQSGQNITRSARPNLRYNPLWCTVGRKVNGSPGQLSHLLQDLAQCCVLRQNRQQTVLIGHRGRGRRKLGERDLLQRARRQWRKYEWGGRHRLLLVGPVVCSGRGRSLGCARIVGPS